MKAFFWLLGGWIKSVFTRSKTIKLLPLLVLPGMLAQATFSEAKVGFAWDPNPEPDLAGYHLYVRAGHPTNTVATPIRVATTTNTTASYAFTNIALYSVWVTAFNTSTMESQPSNVLTINTKSPIPPSTMKMTEFRVTYAVVNCTVTNSYGSATSSAAVLTVDDLRPRGHISGS